MMERQLQLDGLFEGDEQPQPTRFHDHTNGQICIGDAATWLASLPSASVDLVFADPPYNVKKAEWDTFESQQAYVD